MDAAKAVLRYAMELFWTVVPADFGDLIDDMVRKGGFDGTDKVYFFQC